MLLQNEDTDDNQLSSRNLELWWSGMCLPVAVLSCFILPDAAAANAGEASAGTLDLTGAIRTAMSSCPAEQCLSMWSCSTPAALQYGKYMPTSSYT